MHERGPAPNGRNCQRSRPRDGSALNRSGSKVARAVDRLEAGVRVQRLSDLRRGADDVGGEEQAGRALR